MTTTHIVQYTPGGAECSCGRVFDVWVSNVRGTTANKRAGKRGLMRANANRHAEAANRAG